MDFQGFRDEIAAQKDRLFLWVPVAFAAGIAVYFGLSTEPGRYAGVVPLAIVLPACRALYRRHHDGAKWFAGYAGAVAVALALLGFVFAQISTQVSGTPILKKMSGPVSIEGQVESVETLGGTNGSRVVLSHLTIEDVPPAETPRKVRIKFRKDEGIKAGQRIATLAKLDAPSLPVAPGAFDFRRSLFFDGIGAVGFAYKPASVIVESEPGGVALFFERLRTVIDAKIHAGAGVVSAGIMSALVTGERGAIAGEDNDAMRNSGLYHLLSISGTHVSMVAGVLFFFARFLMACVPWMALHWPIKKIAAVFALCGAAFYVFLAGADVPAQRSLMMTGLVLIAVMLDRSPFSLRLIAFSALVVLAIAPYALIGVSFQMSYAAVAALICFFDWARPWWMAWQARAGFVRRSLLYIVGIVLTSLIAGTVTGFFSLYHFQSYAVYGVVSNMIAVPLTGFVIMPAAIVALMLMPFGWEAFALKVMEWGTLWMLAVAHWTAGLNGAVIHVTQWPQATFACFAVGIVLFLMWQGWRGKAVAAVILCAGLVFAAFAPLPDMMIAGSGKLIAVRGDEGDLYFSNGRKDRFTAENWLRLSARDGERPKTFRSDESGVACDDSGCRWRFKDVNVAMPKNVSAFAEDCAWAKVVAAEIPLPEKLCQGPKVFDLFDALDDGARSVYFEGDGIRVETVREAVGLRPWTGLRQKFHRHHRD